MKKILFAIPFIFLACSSPSEQAEKLIRKHVEDSLRNEIRITKARIDSLKKETELLRRAADSLGMPIQGDKK